MKIAIFLEIFPTLSETFILNQITGLIDRGHLVDIYSFARNDIDVVHPDIEKYNLLERTRYFDTIPRKNIAFMIFAIREMIKCFPWLPLRVLKVIGKIIGNGLFSLKPRTIREIFLIPRHSKYDILHCQFGKLGPPILDLKHIGVISGKLVTSFRGYDATVLLDKYPDIYNDLFKEGDLFLPVSDSLKKRILKAGCNPERIQIHRSGIDCSKFELTITKPPNGDPIRILTIGRLIEKKGIPYAIKAVAKLKRQGYTLSYDIVGDGKLRLQLEQMIRDLNLEGDVRLLGWQNHEEIVQLLKQSHILVAPSVTSNGDQEGIPNVLKEAMAMGIPVIGTYHGGIPELIEDGVSGLLVPERDVDALTDKLAYLIEHPEKWQELGSFGYRAVHENYDINILNDSLASLYQKLLTDKKANQRPSFINNIPNA